MLHKNYIIGIDDTDNLESRGTGYLARMLGIALANNRLVLLRNIVRHQLLVHKDIPYTSHNSSASLSVEYIGEAEKIIDFCREYLLKESAEGSDVGLCIASEQLVSDAIVDWGYQAKSIVLTMEKAVLLANAQGVFLEGLRGTKGGIIGAMAAVGLRKSGEDGRLLWLPKLRQTMGVYAAKELYDLINIDIITDIKGNIVPLNAAIYTGEWLRPIMKNKKINLIVEEVLSNEQYKYRVASKEYIKSLTE
ncbi:MAG: hypothetical protein KA792_03795 [Bacteroidales bacterium]|nr:hypothetical protein [Bacteroidales bacterium]